MAVVPPVQFTWDVTTWLQATAEVNSKIQLIESIVSGAQATAVAYGELGDGDYDGTTFASLMLTSVNGDRGLPQQKVVVEYLTTSQQLVIPAGLGFELTDANNGLTPINERLVSRFLKVTSLPFHELVAMLAEHPNPTDLRTTVDAMQVAEYSFKNWEDEAVYDYGDGPPFTRAQRSVVYGVASAALQFNYDLRDTGKLTSPIMRMRDNLWVEAQGIQVERLSCKLMPFTMQSVAALNMAPVGNVALAAYMRAVGLSAGILPDKTSATVIEYRFEIAPAANAKLAAIRALEVQHGEYIYALCMNLIAAFGLLHLNKDHTFKGNDTNMLRIGESYLRSVRTMISEDTMEHIVANQEHVIRTAPHPFGLGQTYAVAQILYHAACLAPALGVRYQTSPPTVQRFAIVRAAMSEWAAVPVGRQINASFAQDRAIIETMCAHIAKFPPAYSALYRLYGVEKQNEPEESAMAALANLLPLVAGYAESQHVGDDNKRDGIALALSLINVRKDAAGLVSAYKSQWDHYMAEMDKVGIMKMAMDARELFGEQT